MRGLFHKQTGEERQQARRAKEVERLSLRLIVCSERGDVAEMVQLLDASDGPVASPTFVDQFGYTALMHAAKEGHVGATQLLIDRQADINMQNKEDGSTALHLAACGEAATTKVLLDAGADTTLRMTDGSTPLVLAATVGMAPIVRLFCQRGVDVSDLERMGGDLLPDSIQTLLRTLKAEFAEEQQAAEAAAAAAATPATDSLFAEGAGETGGGAGSGASGDEGSRVFTVSCSADPVQLPVGALSSPNLNLSGLGGTELAVLASALVAALRITEQEITRRDEKRVAAKAAEQAKGQELGSAMASLSDSVPIAAKYRPARAMHPQSDCPRRIKTN